MLSGLAAMVKTSILNGLSSDPFSFKQDGLASSEVDIGRSEIGDALVVSKMIIVSDEVADSGFEIARKSSSQAGCGSSASGGIVRSCLGSEDGAVHHGCDRSRCLLAIRRDCLRCSLSRCRSTVLAAERPLPHRGRMTEEPW